MTIKQALLTTRKQLKEMGKEDAHLQAKRLLSFVLKRSENDCMVHEEEQITEQERKKIAQYLAQMQEGMPIQYITKEQEFMGVSFYVDENVLIPQPDTEILVEEVMSLYSKESKLTILDLCTGSGCIGISLAKYFTNSKFYLSDISQEALSIAKKNAQDTHTPNVQIVQSNLWENIQNKFDVIVSNPPYIASKEIPFLPKEVQKEPRIALDGGTEGLDFYQKIIRESPKFLKDKGYLCLEMGYDQKEKITNLLEKSNTFQKYYTKKDLAGIDRVVVAQKG